MKTLVVNEKKFASRLLILSFVIVVSVMFSTVPAFATDFEVGTQFGVSHQIPDDDDFSTSFTTTHILSAGYSGGSPTSLYASWFPSKQLAVGPEFNFARVSISRELWGEKKNTTGTSFYLGGRAAYFLLSHAVSGPYVLGRISTTVFSGDALSILANENMMSFGGGLGYQWRIGTAFVLRTEGQYHRSSIKDRNWNEFSLMIGIGTRFGSGENPPPLE